MLSTVGTNYWAMVPAVGAEQWVTGCITLSQTYKFMFFVNLFNYSSIVTACFNKITIFYRDRIIKNDRKYILNGNKYIASIYFLFNPVYSWKITMRFRVRYIIMAERISN